MVKKNSLTVVIITFNRSQSLNQCLRSLSVQTDRNFDVLVIDGDSTDETLKTISSFQDKLKIKVLHDKKLHLAYLRDLGWKKAQGSIVASIDDDVIVSKKWVETIKKTLANREIGGVTGPTVIPKKLLGNRPVFLWQTKIFCKLFMNGENQAVGKIYPSGMWSPGSNFSQALKIKQPRKVDYLEACNFSVPKKIIKEVGGYDLNYKETSEWCEVDLAFRIRKAGYKLLFNSAVAVEHHVSRKGVFIRRLNFTHRLQNFWYFYHHTYYPKTVLGWLQFFLLFISIVFYCFFSIFKRLNLACWSLGLRKRDC